MTPPETAGPRLTGHVPALDGVRGIAIVLVLMVHFTFKYRGETWFGNAIENLMRMGWAGVDVFFVLSGFLITGILLDTRNSIHRYRNFFARRTLRIFPLYFGFLAFAFLVMPAFSAEFADQFQDGLRSQWWYWTYLSNFQALFSEAAAPRALNHFWSLAVEEQFYLLWPAIVFRTSNRRLAQLCCALIVVALLVRIGMRISLVDMSAVSSAHILPARMDTLAIGALAALVARSPLSWNVARRYARFTTLAVILLLMLAAALAPRWEVLNFTAPLMQTIGFPLIAAGSAGLVLIAVDPEETSTRVGRLLTGSTLRTFGKYSYGIYLLHRPIGIWLQNPNILVGPGLLINAAFFVVATAISFLAAYITWHLYEKQFLKLKRFFPRFEHRLPAVHSAPVTTTDLPI